MKIRAAADVGAVARQRRRDLGISQEALAKRAGVTRQWLVRFEQGNTEVSLSKVFAVLAQLDLVLRADPPGSISDALLPKLQIPYSTIPKLHLDEAKLAGVREAIGLVRGA